MSQHQSHLLFRFVLSFFGILFIAFAWFVYEDEEKTFQSKIENLWVRLDDAAGAALKNERSIAAKLSTAVSYVIDLFLGKRLISLQMALVSLPLSIAMGFTAITLISWLQRRSGVLIELRVLRVIWMFAVPALYLGRTSKVSLVLYGSGLVYLTCRYFILPSFLLKLHGSQGAAYATTSAGFIVMVLMLLATILTDLLVLAIVRKLLRSASTWSSKVGAWGLLTFVVLCATILCSSLFFVVKWTRNLSILMPVYWLWLLNIGDALILLFIVGLLVIFFIHHYLFWPALLRPLYSLQRYGIATNRKVFGSIGFALVFWSILYDSRYLHVVFEPIVKKLVGG